LKAKLEEMDRKAVVDALEACAGNQSAAAKALGITRRALIYRIEQYGLARPRGRS
jgi:DNA-binding NtrC family response regulator